MRLRLLLARPREEEATVQWYARSTHSRRGGAASSSTTTTARRRRPVPQPAPRPRHQQPLLLPLLLRWCGSCSCAPGPPYPAAASPPPRAALPTTYYSACLLVLARSGQPPPATHRAPAWAAGSSQLPRALGPGRPRCRPGRCAAPATYHHEQIH